MPVLHLEGNWDNYYLHLFTHFRQEIRRKTKKLEAHGTIVYQQYESPLDPCLFRQFLELEDHSWKGRNKSSILKWEHLLNIYQWLIYLDNPIIHLRLFFMTLNDQLISASLCFKTVDELYVFKIAFAEEFSSYSPGLLLRLFEIRTAFEEGLKVSDFSGWAQPWMNYFKERGHYTIGHDNLSKTFCFTLPLPWLYPLQEGG